MTAIVCIYVAKWRHLNENRSWDDGKKVRSMNNNHDSNGCECQTSTQTLWEVVEVGKKKKTRLEWMNFIIPCNLGWRWCDSWIQKWGVRIQYLARRCHNCHIAAKYSLRDQTFPLIRLRDGYVRRGSNVESSNMISFGTVGGEKDCVYGEMVSLVCMDDFFYNYHRFWWTSPSPAARAEVSRSWSHTWGC